MMDSLMVEGHTLGQKHQNYNKVVNEAIKSTTTQQLTAINYEESDLDNLFKIDIACNSKNVEYVLEVLKCEDMLYVSRAIKKSTWLITDPQYAYIVNPDYLYTHLHPKMSAKAFNKLLLHIRLSLVDEQRVEGFFNYYKEKDLQKALKWLPHCSISFIENIVDKHADDITKQLLKRLCEKSITILEIFNKSYKSYYKRNMLTSTMFLLNQNVDKFLDIIDATDVGDTPYFGPKFTKKVMEKNPERILKNLEKYVNILDVKMFVKFLKKEDVKAFILTHIKNKKMRSWFIYKNIKYFVNKLPVEERFDFIKNVFIEKTYEIEDLEGETLDDVVRYCSAPVRGNLTSAKNIYSWYVYAPFNKAFVDLKQLIRNESNPTERIWILRVLLTCAGTNMKNILTLLKYYREHHINEPFKFKIQFVNYLLTKTDTHRYSKEAWGYLNDLFNSMDVYTKSDKNVPSCVKSIILYNVIHGENIPVVIENKFVFENMMNKNKFNEDEREKVFQYLYKYLTLKLKPDFENEVDFNDTVELVEIILNLLNDWNKELEEYPLILEKIKDLVVAKKKNSWSRGLSGIYNIKKSWKKLLFAESILLNPCQDSCINALKHDPELLDIYRNEIISLCLSDSVIFDRFLKIIRIYYYHSLVNTFKTAYGERLDQKTIHGTLIRGLCMMYKQKELLNFVQKYVPTDPKIDWSQSDELELSLRKNIGTYMYLARPQPPLEVALLYAKGDYLQYVLPSLSAILYNIKSTYIYEHLTELLNTPVSLQKHGIRVAFSKLKLKELKNVFSKLWLLSKNNSIRADIFNQTYMMLCRERDESVILEIWDLLSMFIDRLTPDENKKIYLTLSKSENVPVSVRAAFWMKSYEFLKSLPKKANCDGHLNTLIHQMCDIMEFLDNTCIANIFLENFEKKFTTQRYEYTYQVALFMLSTKTDNALNERYEAFFVPLLDKALAMWDKEHERVNYTRNNLNDIFGYMCTEFEKIVLNKDMVFPIAMYTSVLNKLESSLPLKENYVLLTDIKLSLGYINVLHDLKMNKELDCSKPIEKNVLDEFTKWKHLHKNAAPIFGKLCLDYLKNDVAKYFSNIYIIFSDRLEEKFSQFTGCYQINKLRALKVFLDCKDFIPGQLLVMKVIPTYLYEDEEIAMRFEMLNEISSHPSEEIAMHYWFLKGKDNWK